MAGLAELRQRVLNNVYSAEPQARPSLQRLNGLVANSASDTTVAVDDGSGFVQGDIIEFDDGEQGLVWAVATNDLTVVRGHNSTTTGEHADNEFVKVNPKHTLYDVDEALDEALRDMDAQGLYQLAAGTDITLVSGTDTYELAETDMKFPEGVRAVFYQDSVNSDLIGVPFKQVFDPLSQDFTGDLGIRLLDWGNNSAGDTLSVVYAQDLKDLIDAGLVDERLEDAAVSFATGKLLKGAEGARLHDPGRYTDRTVQPGAELRTGAFWTAEYQRQVWRAKARLKASEKRLPRHPHQRRIDGFVR